MALVPFRAVPFEDVPALPTRPHRWAHTQRRDLTIRTDALGATRVAVCEYGRGPPRLLVHGMGPTGYSWRYVLEPLGARFRLVAVVPRPCPIAIRRESGSPDQQPAAARNRSISSSSAGVRTARSSASSSIPSWGSPAVCSRYSHARPHTSRIASRQAPSSLVVSTR